MRVLRRVSFAGSIRSAASQQRNDALIFPPFLLWPTYAEYFFVTTSRRQSLQLKCAVLRRIISMLRFPRSLRFLISVAASVPAMTFFLASRRMLSPSPPLSLSLSLCLSLSFISSLTYFSTMHGADRSQRCLATFINNAVPTKHRARDTNIAGLLRLNATIPPRTC